VVVRYYSDPSNPVIFIQKRVALNVNNLGFADTAAAWKVQLVVQIPHQAQQKNLRLGLLCSLLVIGEQVSPR